MNQGLSRRPGYGVVSRSSGLPSLFGSGPFALLQQLDEDMNRLFEEMGGALMVGAGATEPGFWSPQVEVCERDGKLHVYADLPGMAKDDIKVDLDEGRLTVEDGASTGAGAAAPGDRAASTGASAATGAAEPSGIAGEPNASASAA